jgi:dihydropteroate synthase
MGIVNVTPDSFSDGGRFLEPGRAIEHGLRLVREGADILDIGGESSRPGAQPISPQEECDRVLPVIQALAREGGSTLLSIDTVKAPVARAALEAGASILNDISALTHDPAQVDVARNFGAGVVLMHMQGSPRTMQKAPAYTNVVTEVTGFLADRIRRLTAAGLAPDTLAVDPGIGFGKTVEHNLDLLANLGALSACGRPVVVGLSRKSVVGQVLNREMGDRLAGSLGAAVYCALRGAHILRVHDVKETADALRMVGELMARERKGEYAAVA